MRWSMLSPLVALVTSFLPLCTLGGRVLVVHPKFAASHVLGVRVLTDELLRRGHEVYVVHIERGIPPQTPHPNLTETILTLDNSDGSVPLFTKEPVARNYLHKDIWDNGRNLIRFIHKDNQAMAAYCHVMLGNTTMIEELKSKPIDLAIVDLGFNECGLALAHHLGAPIVGYWCTLFMGMHASYTAAVNALGTHPYPTQNLPLPMSFTDKLFNCLVHVVQHGYAQVQFAVSRYVATQYLPDTPWTSSILANLTGVLINTNPVLDQARLLPPGFVHVGGFHIRPPPPLPEDLDQFLASNVAGTVVVSFGSVVSVDTLPPEVLPRYAEVFSRLPFNVLFKITGEGTGILGNKTFFSSNVRPVRWMPQTSLLADRRVVAFVTHCGGHSVLEAATFGVPVVGVPLFAEQGDNLLRLVEQGAAVAASTTSTSAELVAAITAVATDPKYRENMAKISLALRDQHKDSPPLAKAVWLLEHVMLTDGALHLKMRQEEGLGLNEFWFYLQILPPLIYFPYKWLTKKTE